jgi:hypothetical protein
LSCPKNVTTATFIYNTYIKRKENVSFYSGKGLPVKVGGHTNTTVDDRTLWTIHLTPLLYEGLM